MRFDTLDWVVVGVYFAGLLGIAVWVARKRQSTAADYRQEADPLRDDRAL